MASTIIILNPTAGRGYGARAESKIRRFLEVEGVEFDLVHTARPWHAAELAEQAVRDGYELVVAAGGDGTTNEVVNGLMTAAEEGEAGTLGVIPVGSGSDFASAVNVPPDLEGACRKLAHGRPRLIDVGRVSTPGRPSRFFDNTAGIGFDGIVTRESSKVKWVRGLALYLPVVLKTLLLHDEWPDVTIQYDGQEMSLTAMMVVICNGGREGGGFLVAPEAALDDGLFDLCIARQLGRLSSLRLIPAFMNGTHVGKEPVTMGRARRVTVTSEDELVVHVDGELFYGDGHRLEFEILPRRLWVRC
ncbi:MAG: diacylglycerol/lipid kinase family protein [Anaerolineae bacterium]